VLTVLTVLRVLTVLTVLTVPMVLGAVVLLESAVKPSTVTLEVSGRASATPSIAAAGRFVAIAWTAALDTDKTADVYVAVSRDAGRTFGAPVRVNDRPGDALSSGEQAPRVSLTPVDGNDPMLTIVWATHLQSSAILIARSRDGGRTFETARRVSPPGATGHRGWPAATSDSHGRSHVVWLDHGNGSWLEYRSSPPVPDKAKPPTPARLAEGVCYCCKTTIAARGDGSIFAAWRHVYPDNIRDIAFVASRDAGRTFDKPLRVSHDGWQINGCPDDGPAMAVDRQGAIHLAWPTVVRSHERKAVFHSVSHDGRTFSPRLEVPNLGSESASHPNIAAGRDGQVAIVWDERRQIGLVELRDGRFSRPRTMNDPDSEGTYPVAAYTADGLLVAWTERNETGSWIAVRR
jgi:hypothetical protein